MKDILYRLEIRSGRFYNINKTDKNSFLIWSQIRKKEVIRIEV